MKTAVSTIVIMVAVGATLGARGGLWQNEDIDVEKAMSNERLFNSYFKCIMDTGPCIPDAQSFKNVLPDLFKTECAQCSQKQKASAKKVIRFMQEKKPEEWKKIANKYDPEGTHIHKFEKSH